MDDCSDRNIISIYDIYVNTENKQFRPRSCPALQCRTLRMHPHRGEPETRISKRSCPTTAGRCAFTASPGRRAAKERAIVERFAGRFGQALTELSEGLAKPRALKRADRVRERIGRPEVRSRELARHYDITVDTDTTGQHATAVRFPRRPPRGSMMTRPGRRPSVHHRHRPSARAGDPHPPAYDRPPRRLDRPPPDSRRSATHHRRPPARRRTHPACAQGDTARSAPNGHPRRLGHRSRTGRDPQDRRPDRPEAHRCSAT